MERALRTKRPGARKRPDIRIGDRVTLADHVCTAYYPGLLRDTVLRVSSVSGNGTARAPWVVSVTDDRGNFWRNDPDDFTKVT